MGSIWFNYSTSQCRKAGIWRTLISVLVVLVAGAYARPYLVEKMTSIVLCYKCCHYHNIIGQVTTTSNYPEQVGDGAPVALGGRVPECWSHFYQKAVGRPLPITNSYREGGTIFLGTLAAPDGHSRLVAVDYEAGVSVQIWSSHFVARVFQASLLNDSKLLFEMRYGQFDSGCAFGGDFRVYAATRDLSNASHIIFDYRDETKDVDDHISPFDNTVDGLSHPQFHRA